MSVYFLRGEGDGPVKIGFSDFENERRQSVQVGAASALSIVRTVAGGKTVEAWFHRHFKEHRIRGEWFEFVPEMMTAEPPPSLVNADANRSGRQRDHLETDFSAASIECEAMKKWSYEDKMRAGLRILARREAERAAFYSEKALDLCKRAGRDGDDAKVSHYLEICEKFLQIARYWESEIYANQGRSTADEILFQRAISIGRGM